MTWDNNFDWWSLFICFLLAVIEVIIAVVIVWNFRVAHNAGLNIGICVGIFSIFPFLVAVFERICFGTKLTCSQFVGMLGLVGMAVLISLSDVLKPQIGGENIAAIVIEDKSVPIFVAVLASLIIPVLFTLGTALVKYGDVVLQVDAYDFSFGYWFILSVGLTIFDIVHLLTHNDSKVLSLWI